MTDDSLVLRINDAKQDAGWITSLHISSGLLYDLSSENEYFAKRIIIMEMNN